MIDMLSLVGGRIVDYEVVEDTPVGNVPAFLIQKANRFYQIEVASDEEFNSGGVLHIEDVTDEVIG